MTEREDHLNSSLDSMARVAGRRERILKATGRAAEHLLHDSLAGPAFDEALAVLGQATEVSRVYVFEFCPGADGGQYCSQRFEWCAPGVVPQIDNPDLKDLDLSAVGFNRWMDELQAGRTLHGRVAEFPAAEQPLLEMQEIKSLVVMPIKSADRLWGFIGFDDCAVAQAWPDDVVDCLFVAARVVGAAIDRGLYRTARDVLLEEYQETINGLSEIVFRADMAGRWLFLSPGWTTVTGLDSASMLGQRCVDAMEPEDRPAVSTALKNLFDGSISQCRQELRLRCADGGNRWVLSNVRLLPATAQRGAILAGSMTDIDDAKRTQAELDAARVAAESANRAKSEFLSTMSHELRTPLNGVIGLSESIMEMTEPVDWPRVLRYTGIVHRSGHQLLRQINGILELARLESGQLRLQLATLSAESVLLAALKDLRAKAEERKIVLVREDGAGEGLVFTGDERCLRNAFSRVAENAVKFTPEGGRVSLGARIVGQNFVELSVTDDGPGISPETQARLFQPFSQGDSSMARAHGGAGLGLTLASRIVRLHGGSIELKSAPDCGSRFALLIPINPAVSA